MGQVYIPDIIRNSYTPIFNTPPFYEYSSEVYEYDYSTGNYVPSGSSLPIYLQEVSTSLDKQHYRDYCNLDSFKLQTIDHNVIDDLTNQYWGGYLGSNSRHLQRNVVDTTTASVSSQYILEYTFKCDLQRIAFSNKEPDKIIWNVRAVDASTGDYRYWSTTWLYSLPKWNYVRNSREILSTYFVKGTKEINLTGYLYSTDTGSVTYTADMMTPFVYQAYAESPVILVLDSDNDGNIDLDEQGKEIWEEQQNVPSRQLYIQKCNLIDSNSILELWVNRGKYVVDGRYIYWKEADIAANNTTYNTLNDTKESLNTVFKKQE